MGSGTVIDIRLFPANFQNHGIDLNENACDIAKEKIPIVNFKKGTIKDLTFDDSSIDFVVKHQVLNYLDDDTLEKGVAEKYRVAGKYIMNCEKY